MSEDVDRRLAIAWEQGRLAGLEQGHREADLGRSTEAPENPYGTVRSAPEGSKTYISVIKYRSPERKAHMNIGQAKNAVAYSNHYPYVRGGEIWEVTEHGQFLIYDVPQKTHRDELPWRKK